MQFGLTPANSAVNANNHGLYFAFAIGPHHLIAVEGRSTPDLLGCDVGAISAEPFVVTELLPGDGVVMFPESEEASERYAAYRTFPLTFSIINRLMVPMRLPDGSYTAVPSTRSLAMVGLAALRFERLKPFSSTPAAVTALLIPEGHSPSEVS